MRWAMWQTQSDTYFTIAPPYLCAVVVVSTWQSYHTSLIICNSFELQMIVLAHSSDKRNERTFHAIASASICIVGYVLLMILTSREALYAAVCIAVSGIFVVNPVVNAWLMSNIAPEMKRSIAAAMAVSANNASGKSLRPVYSFTDIYCWLSQTGLLGSNIYRRSDAPRYCKYFACLDISCYANEYTSVWAYDCADILDHIYIASAVPAICAFASKSDQGKSNQRSWSWRWRFGGGSTGGPRCWWRPRRWRGSRVPVPSVNFEKQICLMYSSIS